MRVIQTKRMIVELWVECLALAMEIGYGYYNL